MLIKMGRHLGTEFLPVVLGDFFYSLKIIFNFIPLASKLVWYHCCTRWTRIIFELSFLSGFKSLFNPCNSSETHKGVRAFSLRKELERMKAISGFR